MPLCSEFPRPVATARACSEKITASCRKLPPPPPYSSGMPGHSKPAAPALYQTSRSTQRCSDQRGSWGASSFSQKRRALSCSASSSDVIQDRLGVGDGSFGSDDAARAVGPVPNTQHALVQLAVVLPRKVRFEVDGAWALDRRQVLA